LGPMLIIWWNNWPAFSSNVIRWSRSSTRSSTDRDAFRYGKSAVSVCLGYDRGRWRSCEAGTLIADAIAVAARKKEVKMFCFRRLHFCLAMAIGLEMALGILGASSSIGTLSDYLYSCLGAFLLVSRPWCPPQPDFTRH